jgi:hypothetical protein
MANSRFGLRTRLGLVRAYSEGNRAIDADAQAFYDATGITDETQKVAINSLVLDLKSYGIWSKMKALYPFVGGTASTHKFNLKDSQDTNGAYRLTFFGGWTHDSNGVLPNGTTGYADTFLTLNAAGAFNNYHFSFYCNNNPAADGTIRVDMGKGTTFYANLYIRLDNTNDFGGSLGSRNATSTNTDSRCYAIITSISSILAKLYKNGSVVASNTNTQTATASNTATIYIGSQGFDSTAAQFSNKRCALASIGDGLTDTEAGNLYTAVQAFQTTLGRQV